VIAVGVADLARLVNGQLVGDAGGAVVTSVTVDSRTIGPGSLFVALPGEHADGHQFIAAAWRAGATAALTGRAVEAPAGPYVIVADPLAALGRLARHLVDTAHGWGLQVVGITGSQGKTSTKDLLAAILERSGPTVAPYGNLNNELGVPLTVARTEMDTRYLVCELGARGVGHIRSLCAIAPPDVGVVLNVGQAHVGEFGSQEAIAQAKGELVEALPAHGVAVLNADDPLVWAMRRRTTAPVLAWSGTGPVNGDGVWAESIEVDARGRPRFLLHARPADGLLRTETVRMQLTGRHHVPNALAAAAAALAVGVDLPEIAAGLDQARNRSRWRMEITERADGVLVVNDSYNANPDSMRAALTTLAELGQAAAAGRTWAVLGDMLELGPTARAEHVALGRYVAELGIDRLAVVGQHATVVADAAVAAGLPVGHAVVAPSRARLTELVTAGLRSRDVVLVKASRGLALDAVAEQLLAAPARTVRGEHPA
jgi:UDP-N-acetylmuramoyl-tripeptide--D-alanyl-D-alanine ligase